MKKAFYLLLAFLFVTPGAFAQSRSSDDFNVGVFGNFIELGNSSVGLGGAGARVSVRVAREFQLEAESSYNFESSYSSGNSDSNGTISVSTTRVRLLDGLFGPRLYVNKGRVRFFVTAKGGFMNFNLETSPTLDFNQVASAFEGLNRSNVFGTFYPGGGGEAFWGPIGIRVDIGDEIFFNSGPHNNLKVSAGPTIRF
jgi:hypothetical protein